MFANAKDAVRSFILTNRYASFLRKHAKSEPNRAKERRLNVFSSIYYFFLLIRGEAMII